MNSNQNPNQKGLSSVFGEVIFSYTRAQAIEDGRLVDVTQVAQEAGFRFPTAITAALWADIETIPSNHAYQDIQGRLWDVLYMAAGNARRNKNVSQFTYELILHRVGVEEETISLICDIGPGDDAEPVLTIGYQEDF
jgi:hypothetical protein